MAALDAPAAVPPKAGIDRGLRYAIVAATIAVLGILVYGTVATTRAAPPIPTSVTMPAGARRSRSSRSRPRRGSSPTSGSSRTSSASTAPAKAPPTPASSPPGSATAPSSRSPNARSRLGLEVWSHSIYEALHADPHEHGQSHEH